MVRHQERISPLSSRTGYERLVHLHLQREVLSMYSTPLRLGEVATLVYYIHGTFRTSNKGDELPGPMLAGRLPRRNQSLFSTCDTSELHQSCREDREVDGRTGTSEASHERGIEGRSSSPAFGSHGGQRHNAL